MLLQTSFVSAEIFSIAMNWVQPAKSSPTLNPAKAFSVVPAKLKCFLTFLSSRNFIVGDAACPLSDCKAGKASLEWSSWTLRVSQLIPQPHKQRDGPKETTMKDEYWATFSIYDHRTSLYRQALVLFDRIVVPIPTRTVGSLTAQEIAGMEADVKFLEDRGAAKRVDWDPDEFAQWRQQAEAAEAGQQEALARRLVNDPPLLTRLQLKEKTDKQVSALLPPDVISVTAVPVYSTPQAYDVSSADLGRHWLAEKVTLEVVLKQIPVPAESASFDDILLLRDTASFQASLAALRQWQRKTVDELLQENDEASARRAARDFSEMIRKYAESLAEAHYKQVTTTITSMLALGAAFSAVAGPLVGTLAAVASPVFSIRKLLRPCWKDLEEKQCFPAGVVYSAQQLA
jgi:hypothetical protein